MSPPRRRVRRRRGFTLIELIATIVVLATVGTVASAIVMNATGGYVEASTAAQLHAEASVALDRIVRELRSMNLDTDATGIAPDIESIASSAITWNDDDTLTLTGSNLTLAEDGGSAVVLLGDVSAFTIAASDEDDASVPLPASAASCDPIRRLTITVTVTRHGVSETLRSKLYLRCTMAGAGS
ncbi:MAG: PilW family protein [Planctomycetota bacterium]